MLEVGSLLSLFGAVNTTVDFCKNVSALWQGRDRDRLLRELVDHNRAMRAGIERLSDQILYAPDLQGVEDLTRSQPRRVEDLRELRAGLEPVQRALGGELLSSSAILTPDRMRQALAKDPWEVLMDVRPLAFFNASIPREGVPVRFEHDGVAYLGWQMRGALPMLFDCAVHPQAAGHWVAWPHHPTSPAALGRGTAIVPGSPQGRRRGAGAGDPAERPLPDGRHRR